LDKPVSDEILKHLADLANKAPCAGALHISIITDQGLLDEINQETYNYMHNSGVPFLVERSSIPGYSPLYGAPAMIVISADPARGLANAACAADTLILAATDLGLGTCYLASILNVLDGESPTSLKLNLPEGLKPWVGVIVGYTDDPDYMSRERNTGDNIDFI
jgi:nitroreductase